MAINCEPVKPRLLQTGLFIPLAPEPEKLELMLARLAKLVGAENIGSPELLDTHRPDAFRVKRFELKEAKRKKKVNSKQQTADSSASVEQSAIRNPQSEIGTGLSSFPAAVASAWCRRKEDVRERLAPGTKTEVCMERWLVWLVPGARRATGGVRTVGRGMNGMWRVESWLESWRFTASALSHLS